MPRPTATSSPKAQLAINRKKPDAPKFRPVAYKVTGNKQEGKQNPKPPVYAVKPVAYKRSTPIAKNKTAPDLLSPVRHLLVLTSTIIKKSIQGIFSSKHSDHSWN